jgi:Mrp family chromosome partitioning ATPase
VRWKHTPRDAVQASLRILSQLRHKISGVVFNRVNVKKEAQYGYGYGYALNRYSKNYYKN